MNPTLQIMSGLNVSEVAHDHQVQVKKYVVEELHLKNSSDTWHGKSFFIPCCHTCKLSCSAFTSGTKGVAKAMNKIAQGPAYKEGTTWFQQLFDKRM